MSEHVHILAFDHTSECGKGQNWTDVEGPEHCPTCADRGIRYVPGAELEALKAENAERSHTLLMIAERCEELAADIRSGKTSAWEILGTIVVTGKKARKTLASNKEG